MSLRVNSRDLISAAAFGLLAGVFIGALVWLIRALSHSYLSYGMFRLAFLNLVDSLNPATLVYVVIAIALYAVSVLLLRKTGWTRRSVCLLGAMGGTLAVMLFGLDRVLRARTGDTLFLAVRGMGEGAVGFRVVLLAAFLLGVPITFWLMRKLPWERLVDGVMARSRLLGRAALAGLISILLINIAGFIATSFFSPSGPNIIIITVDCLRPDHVGYYGYRRPTTPELDRRCKSAVVFTNAFSNAPWTKPAIGTLFTSLYPNVHTAVGELSVLPQGALTLAEVLKNEGYRTIYMNASNPFITERFGFHQGFDMAEDFYPPCNASYLTDRFLATLRGLGGKKVFAYLHYMDVHVPYWENEFSFAFADTLEDESLLPWRIGTEKIRNRTAGGELSGDEMRNIIGFYDGQIKYVDTYLSEVFRELEAAGMHNETIVVIAADHGEEFWDHGNFEHGHSVYNELLHVPLIMVGPGLSPKRVDCRVSLIDLMPTVLDLAGVGSEQFSLQGLSLAGAIRGSAPDSSEMPVFAMGTLYGPERYCLISGRSKIIVNTDSREDKMPVIGYESRSPAELYDLLRDPGEQNDIRRTNPRLMGDLGKRLGKFRDLPPMVRGRFTVRDEELKRKMRSVGYL